MSRIWPSGGAHLFASGGSSESQTHARGHLVYAARGVLSVHTTRGTSIVPANRVAWTPAGFAHQHRAHSRADMRIVFLPPSLARLVPDGPVVFEVSNLAREILLALTGSRRQPTRRPAPRAGRDPVQLRVCHTLILLADGHDTTYVAHACGWSNPSSFIAAFAGLVGTTPRRHRS